MIWRWRYGFVLVPLILSISPALSALWAAWFAERHGCILHEGFANPCIVDGADWGEALYSAFVLGWLMLATLPVAAFLAMVLVTLIAIDLTRRFTRR